MNVSRLREGCARVFRGLPAFRGKTRAIRILNWGFNRLGASSKAKCGMSTGGQLWLDLRSRTEFVPYYLGGYDTEVIRGLLERFESGWVVLDVGANIGFFSVPFALRLRELSGRLYSFEPVPSNFSRLSENLELNGLRAIAKPERIALSNQSAVLKMTLREDFQGGGETGNAAILIQDGQDAAFQTVDVHAIRLDDYVVSAGLNRLDLIKVDIEGHEGDFLEGARESIARFRPVILSEFNEAYFKRKGVDIDQLCNRVFDGLSYVYLRQAASGGWERCSTLIGRDVAEDVLLVPAEKVSRWQGAGR